jgi:hypothetical protein
VSIFNRAYAERLLNDLKAANTEAAKKERFLQYLSLTFAQDHGGQQLIADMALGAEMTVTNIPRGERDGTGRADTQTQTLIIEWERDLAKTGEHAVEQLSDYLAGNWRSGREYRFKLIATDGLRWRLYAPDWSHLRARDLHFGPNYQLRETRRFDLTPETVGDFPFFLDEVLFVSRKKPATLSNIQADFGDTSEAFINSMLALKTCADEVPKRSELSVAYDQWVRFLSLAYGRFDATPEKFLVHTYLSVFAKLIAFAVVSGEPADDDSLLQSILDGSAFERLNVERFVEDDFFHWVGSSDLFRRVRPMFRELNRALSHYDSQLLTKIS